MKKIQKKMRLTLLVRAHIYDIANTIFADNKSISGVVLNRNNKAAEAK